MQLAWCTVLCGAVYTACTLSLLTRALRLRCAVNDVMVLAQDKKSSGYYPNMAFAFGTKVDKAICEKAAAAKAPMGARS